MASLAQEAKQSGSEVSKCAMKSCCRGEERQGTAGTQPVSDPLNDAQRPVATAARCTYNMVQVSKRSLNGL